MNKSIRLWQLSDGIQQLENAIANIQENETLTDEELENQLQQTFDEWLQAGESFNWSLD